MAKTHHLSVFFNDKSNDQQGEFLTNLFHKHIDTSADQESMVFDGCGEEFGFIRGRFLGAGVDEHCRRVVDKVTPLLVKLKEDEKLVLNLYGSGQGAITALMVSMALGKIPKNKLEINLALLDPVSGNWLSTAMLDWFKISLSNKVVDLTQCIPLKRVLALYTNQTENALRAHSPVFPEYSAETEELTIDVIPGTYTDPENGSLSSKESFISFARFYKFLSDCGTRFKPFNDLTTFDMNPVSDDFCRQQPNDKIDFDNLDPRLKTAYAQLNNEADLKESFTRDMHSITGAEINTRTGEFKYLNRHHRELVDGSDKHTPVRMSVDPTNSVVAGFNRFTVQYPRVWRAIKWSVLVLVCTGIFALLTVNPLMGALIGAGIGLSSLAVWHGLVKPAIKKSVNSIVYPQYEEVDPSDYNSTKMHETLTQGKELKQGDVGCEEEIKDTPSEKVVVPTVEYTPDSDSNHNFEDGLQSPAY